MENAYSIQEVEFDEEYLFLKIDGHAVKLRLTDISEKLAKASESEKNDYSISPSGYGINWKSLDEDLSINGLLRMAQSQYILP